ncbi:retrovirus-related Pol polyprotein from transposon 17.6 [Trichonephila clavipes]|nr:retrovirus-related Pol polyprotein from transposon 17.6 [Trichonephila clavipes]
MRMDIELISDKPIKTKPYRMPPRQINILREEIKRLLELGVIEIGQSDYTSPLILVESPNKDPRPCVDLSQRIEGEEHPIVFLSKKFSKAERNYSTVERELVAIIFGLKRLKHYLDGQKFIIETDHNPLRYLNKMGSTNPRLQRWALSLQPFNFEIKHKPGRLHGNADGLSRLE